MFVSLYLASNGALQTPVRSVSAESTRAAGGARPAVNGVSGPTFNKPLSMPDPIPEAGQQRALELMKSGALFRYTPGVLSETSLAEADMCEATGFKYSVGFNSAGSALFIALKSVGVQPGDKVLANAFSFTAVPSAIHHAGAVPVYVEATDAYVMCIDDLRRKLQADDSIKYLMLTHMRGKVTDMQAAYELAEEFDVEVIEDCAHALGIQWDGVQLGRSARGELHPALACATHHTAPHSCQCAPRQRDACCEPCTRQPAVWASRVLTVSPPLAPLCSRMLLDAVGQGDQLG